MGLGPEENPLPFGEDLDVGTEAGFFFSLCLFSCETFFDIFINSQGMMHGSMSECNMMRILDLVILKHKFSSYGWFKEVFEEE